MGFAADWAGVPNVAAATSIAPRVTARLCSYRPIDAVFQSRNTVEVFEDVAAAERWLTAA